MRADDRKELDQLETEIAAHRDSEDAADRFRAGTVMYKKAALIERLEGAESAVRLFEEIPVLMAGAGEAGPRELLICALRDVAILHDQLGNDPESRSVAEGLIAEHFKDPPDQAVLAVVRATRLLMRQLHDMGESDRAVRLGEELIGQHGQPGSPDYVDTAAGARMAIAGIIGEAGDLEAGILRYAMVAQQFADATDATGRAILATALGREADFLFEAGRTDEGVTICRRLITEFAGSEDSRVVEFVEWAQTCLDQLGPASRSRRRWRRP